MYWRYCVDGVKIKIDEGINKLLLLMLKYFFQRIHICQAQSVSTTFTRNLRTFFKLARGPNILDKSPFRESNYRESRNKL